MRRAALFAATVSLVALAAPAQARHNHRDRMEQEADDLGHGFHRYYGSEYGGTEDVARERVPERRDGQRRGRRSERERDLDRAPPRPSI